MFQNESVNIGASDRTVSSGEVASAGLPESSPGYYRRLIQEVGIVGAYWINDNHLPASGSPVKEALCLMHSGLLRFCDLAEKIIDSSSNKSSRQDAISANQSEFEASEKEIRTLIKKVASSAPDDAAIKEIAEESLVLVEGIRGMVGPRPDKLHSEKMPAQEAPDQRMAVSGSLAEIYEHVRIKAIEKIQENFVTANFGTAKEKEACGLEPDMLIELAGAVNTALSDDSKSVFSPLKTYAQQARQFDTKNRNDSSYPHLKLCNEIKNLIISEMRALCDDAGQPVPGEIEKGLRDFSRPPAKKKEASPEGARNTENDLSAATTGSGGGTGEAKAGSSGVREAPVEPDRAGVPASAAVVAEGTKAAPAAIESPAVAASKEHKPPLSIVAPPNISEQALPSHPGTSEPGEAVQTDVVATGQKGVLKRWSGIAAAILLAGSTFFLGRMSVQRTEVEEPSRVAHVEKEPAASGPKPLELTENRSSLEELADSEIFLTDGPGAINIEPAAFETTPVTTSAAVIEEPVQVVDYSEKLDALHTLGSKIVTLLEGVYQNTKTIAANLIQNRNRSEPVVAADERELENEPFEHNWPEIVPSTVLEEQYRSTVAQGEHLEASLTEIPLSSNSEIQAQSESTVAQSEPVLADKEAVTRLNHEDGANFIEVHEIGKADGAEGEAPFLRPEELGTYYSVGPRRSLGMEISESERRAAERNRNNDFFDFSGPGIFPKLVFPGILQFQRTESPAEVSPVPARYRLERREQEAAPDSGDQSFLTPHLLGSEDLSVAAVEPTPRRPRNDADYILNPFALGRGDVRGISSTGYLKTQREGPILAADEEKTEPAPYTSLLQPPSGRLLSIKKN